MDGTKQMRFTKSLVIRGRLAIQAYPALRRVLFVLHCGLAFPAAKSFQAFFATVGKFEHLPFQPVSYSKSGPPVGHGCPRFKRNRTGGGGKRRICKNANVVPDTFMEIRRWFKRNGVKTVQGFLPSLMVFRMA